MKIAVVTRFLRLPLDGIGHHTFEILSYLIEKYSDVQWHLIHDGRSNQIKWSQNNVTHHRLYPPTRHPWLWQIWYEWRLPSLLESLGTDAIWYPDGLMSLAAKTPSLLTIHDLAYLKYPQGSITSHRRYLESIMHRQIIKADKIACVSQFIRDEIVEAFHTDPNKIIITYNAPNSNFKPLSEEEKKRFRNTYTQSQPYFLYLGSIHPRKNISNLIKAYEVFGKHSNYKLVIAGQWAWKSSDFRRQLEKSPARTDIILLDQLENIRYQLVGAATAMVYISHYEGFGMPVIEALACGVPVITSRESAMQEITFNQGLYVDPTDPDQIAKAMQAVVTQRASMQLMDQRVSQASQFSWNASAEVIFKNLVR